MAWAATAQNQINNPTEMNGSQISQEDMEKLQEIHELINLLFAELTSRPMQNTATSYAPTGPSPGMTPGMVSAMPAAPYAHSMFQYAWGMSPYLRMPGF